MADNICKNFRKEECCGCGACVNICPTGALSYGRDQYGFTIPQIEESKCIYCEKCIDVCPFIQCKNGEGARIPLRTYAALTKRADEVFRSTSGGIFIVLAKEVILRGGIVVGCTMDSAFKVKHIIVSTEDDLKSLQKSKYVQSDMGYIYREVKRTLLQKKKVLFSGTPCEVAAIKRFLGNMDTTDLYLVEVVCHGVPSQEFFDDYIKNLHDVAGGLKKYTFRIKRKAENGMNWFFSYQRENGESVIKNWPEDSFNYYYMKSYSYRDGCYQCPFARERRQADITLCDYWHWEKYHETKFSPNATVSGVLVNTEKGENLFEVLKDHFQMEETKFDDIIRHNGCLQRPSPCPDGRNNVLNTWKIKGYGYLDREFRRKYKRQIWKYSVMRHVPNSVIRVLHSWRG